jgi:hypothetical protein
MEKGRKSCNAMKLVVQTTKTFPNNKSLNLSEKLENLKDLPGHRS